MCANTGFALPPSGIIVMALLGMFNVHRHGAINSAAILLYALTCCISGYVSSHFYRQIGGERWVWNIILTTSLFSGEHCPLPYWACPGLRGPRVHRGTCRRTEEGSKGSLEVKETIRKEDKNAFLKLI